MLRDERAERSPSRARVWELTPGSFHAPKRFFRRAAREFAREDPKAAARFERASAHWLRHTHGSHAVAANVPIEVVQNNLGHASLSTTTIYVTSEKRRRYREMAKFLGAR